MRDCLIRTRAYRTSAVLYAILGSVIALLVACGGSVITPIKGLNIPVAGQTVTKVRTAGNEIVMLQERLDIHL